MKRTWAIGDVHNHLSQLTELLDQIPSEDPLVFIGDLIHKGPGENARTIVALAKQLVDSGRAVVIRGNHEEKAGKPRWVGEEKSLSGEQVAWLKSRPLFFRKGGTLYIHGGIDTSVSAQLDSLISQALLPETGDWTPGMVNAAVTTLSRKNRERLKKCMYVRFLDPKGKNRTFGDELDGDPFWATNYDGKYGQVVFGHNPFSPGGAVFSNAVGIDCGVGNSVFPATRTRAVNAATLGLKQGLVALACDPLPNPDWVLLISK